MHRIDSDGHVNFRFSEAPPSTEIDADWMNAVQEEICNLIEAMGISLVKGNYTQLRDAAVAAATANKLVRRDANGRAQVADPSVSADIDTKGARDEAITTHDAVTNPHSAVAAPTASRLVLRDANGRAQFADPAAAQDADTKGAREAAITAALFTPTPLETTPASSNWDLAGAPGIQYWKDHHNIVHLAGGIRRATAQAAGGLTLVTLPAGYRPAVQREYSVARHVPTGSVYDSAYLQVTTGGGVVTVYNDLAEGAFYFVDAVSFVAA